MGKKLTTEQFIERAHVVHNNQYDYSLTTYSGMFKKVIIICTEHGEFEQTTSDHLAGNGCQKCAVNKRVQTTEGRYGVKYAMQSDVVKNKFKKTMLQEYGVDNPLKSKIIKERAKKTNIERYGVAYPQQATIVRDKVNATNLKKYGSICSQAGETVKEKTKTAMLAKYGVDHNWKNKDVRVKITNTMFERYGVELYNQHQIIDVLPLLQDYDWLYDQYIIQNKTTTQIATEFNICSTTVLNYLNNHEIAVRGLTQYSYKCINWLESIMKQEGIYIQHALNEGEYQIPDTRFKADGYCNITNTIYEFHGDCWHGNPAVYESHELCNPFSDLTAGELYTKTIERENQIIALGYNLVVMWEDEF